MSWKHQEISDSAEAWVYEWRPDRVIVIKFEWGDPASRAAEPLKPKRRWGPTIRSLIGMTPAPQDYAGDIADIPWLVRKATKVKADEHNITIPDADTAL